MIEKLNNFYDW